MEKLDSWIHPHLLIPVFEFRVPGDKCGSQPALWQGALWALLMNNFGRRAEEMDIYNPTGESLLDLIQLSQPVRLTPAPHPSEENLGSAPRAPENLGSSPLSCQPFLT